MNLFRRANDPVEIDGLQYVETMTKEEAISRITPPFVEQDFKGYAETVYNILEEHFKTAGLFRQHPPDIQKLKEDFFKKFGKQSFRVYPLSQCWDIWEFFLPAIQSDQFRQPEQPASDKKLSDLVGKLHRGCDCAHDYRCVNCQSIADVKEYLRSMESKPEQPTETNLIAFYENIRERTSKELSDQFLPGYDKATLTERMKMTEMILCHLRSEQPGRTDGGGELPLAEITDDAMTIDLHEWVKKIIEEPTGFKVWEDREWVIHHVSREVSIASFVMRCLANKECEGSEQALNAILRRRGGRDH